MSQQGDPRVSGVPLRVRIVTQLQGDVAKPVRRLDRWLLRILYEEGAFSTDEVLASTRLRRGPTPPDEETVHLRAEHLELWLHEALRRGLISPVSVDVRGAARSPAAWILSEFGVQRLREVGGRRARWVDRLARMLAVEDAWRASVKELQAQEVATGELPPPRTGMPRITVSPGDSDEAQARADEQLQRIDHIVVLMMENRSFDHMFGWLGYQEQPEINGLQHAHPNDYEGDRFESTRLVGTRFEKAIDPPHGSDAIHDQIADGAMSGFVRAFAHADPTADPGAIMGYYTSQELPVYDFLAHHYCVCDAWHSSVPSATWPNRCWSIAGRSVRGVEGLFGQGRTLFDLDSFVYHLDEQGPDMWRWYSYDPASLRLVDGQYRPDPRGVFDDKPKEPGLWHDNFRFVDRHSIDDASPQAEGVYEVTEGTSLFEDLARGDLAKVTWIDPNFIDLSIKDPTSNDDHPPSDVRAGQDLVRRLYQALRSTKAWPRTLFVITYDEHGGFYDHQPPPPAPEADPEFPTYGVRVPGLVISPLVEPHTVSHTLFDHSSIVKTILQRFAPDKLDAMTEGGAHRLPFADHLGRLLTREEPHAEPSVEEVRKMEQAQEAWRVSQALERAQAATPTAPEPGRVRGFPAEYMAASRLLREDGRIPAAHP
jgi:phospholipase C